MLHMGAYPVSVDTAIALHCPTKPIEWVREFGLSDNTELIPEGRIANVCRIKTHFAPLLQFQFADDLSQ